MHGRGCYQCSNSGYRGRLGVYEMLEMNEAMLDALRRQDIAGFTREARLSPLYRPLGLCAMDFALQGVTTLEEVARVAATSEGDVSLDEVPVLSQSSGDSGADNPAPNEGGV